MHFTPLISTHVPLTQLYEFFLSLFIKQTGKRKKRLLPATKLKIIMKKHNPHKHKRTQTKTIKTQIQKQ